MDELTSSIALSRLLQLSSPMLPVGAYCYSQGLEWAIESGDVHDPASAKKWIGEALAIQMVGYELPWLYQLAQAWKRRDMGAVVELDQRYQAGKDTAESFAESRQTGYSLGRLLASLEGLSSELLQSITLLENPAYPTLYAAVCVEWDIANAPMLHAYAWSWLENQVSVTLKAVPLGQVAGQNILLALAAELPKLTEQVMQCELEDICNFYPGLTIAGCMHETQYSRLFRS